MRMRPDHVLRSRIRLVVAAGVSISAHVAVAESLHPDPQRLGAAFYGDPPDAAHPWGVHDRNRPQPEVVSTAGAVTIPPPSDAVVLFDGKDLSGWELERPKPGKEWVIHDETMECVPGAGSIRTKEKIGDCQLHIEWAAPSLVKGEGQGRGNSGVFLMGLTEVQILDNFENSSYPDGSAGAVYGVNPPMKNALQPPGEFNSYDIVFRRPIFQDGKQVDPGYLTVFCNGVLIQDHTPLEGGGGHRKRSKPTEFPESGPLKLQNHGNAVRFRNIWYRSLPPRAVEGGTSGALEPQVTSGLRQEIAAALRGDALSLRGGDGLREFYRSLESLVYAPDASMLARSKELSTAYLAVVENTAREEREKHKKAVLEMRRCLSYMVKHGRVDADFPARRKVDALVEEMDWDPKKKQ